MSADFHSSNPFRRKTPSSGPPQRSPSINHHIAYPQTDAQPGFNSLKSVDTPKKVTKKVRVQSPPPSSPTISYFPPTSGEDAYSIPEKPPTPIPRHDDPFSTNSTDMPDDGEPRRSSKAPANPFSKTLETMENRDREPQVSSPTNNTSAGRASMDVDAFKRLLMTGIGGPGTPLIHTASQAHIAHALGDEGSSTETSSLSRQSIFEPIQQESHSNSPRTSHEVSEPEDERRYFTAEPHSYTPSSRKKPPPAPSSRHGKLIRLELRDDPPLLSNLPTTPGSATSPQYFSSSPQSQSEANHSQTDLNKPLPPAPSRTSHDSERESVFDREALGKTPEPPSPSASVRRKIAPPPPATRRHSQLFYDSKLTRSDSSRLSPKPEAEEEVASINTHANANAGFLSDEPGRSRSNSNNSKAPPPPPSRRPTRISSSGSSHNEGVSRSPSSISLPAPPPARGSSVRASKAPSVMSMDLSTGGNGSNKRVSLYGPPPPPRRHGRGSGVEGSGEGTPRRQSGEYAGRRSVESTRRASISSSIQEETELPVGIGIRMGEGKDGKGGKSRQDILADLSKLQRDIDALRVQSEREKERVS